MDKDFEGDRARFSLLMHRPWVRKKRNASLRKTKGNSFLGGHRPEIWDHLSVQLKQCLGRSSSGREQLALFLKQGAKKVRENRPKLLDRNRK